MSITINVGETAPAWLADVVNYRVGVAGEILPTVEA